MKHLLSIISAFILVAIPIRATKVTMKMNTTSPTITMVSKASGDTLDIGQPTSRIYTFDANSGDYIVTAYGTDNKTINGTIEVFVSDSLEQQITILTNTIYATNKTADNTLWKYGEDYSINVDVFSREGAKQVVTLGNSITSGRKTILALNGNSLYVEMVPSEAHAAEGYMPFYRSATLTAGINVSGAIPMGGDFTITAPKDAQLKLGMKFTHFTDFKYVEPVKVERDGNLNRYFFRLANSQTYNYRTWMKDGLTQGGYFTMSTDSTRCPSVNFTESDYTSFNPKTINHTVEANDGYETGDILVNINPRGHLNLKTGESFKAHAMRSWQLTDNSTNNYFIEPDFHYTVIGMDGKPSTGVIEIDNANTSTDPWSTIRAIGKGDAIVLVTYDAIGLNYYSGAKKTAYMGGEHWGAIWPENTAVYVVSVDGGETSSIKTNMTINEEYNQGALRMAGSNVDAEHDVFYYLDTEQGATYTFKPEGVVKVEIARPAIGEQTVSYTGFSTDGVTLDSEGIYSIILTEGRNIVRLSDASGNAVYQVMTAKPCHREIENVTRPGSQIFQPGDRVKVQFSGLRHPANKLAGIYNMSAYVTYNGVPNGTSLILSANQYKFGSAASAQAVTFDIPADYDELLSPEMVMDRGTIQVNGYGDPIGNHRFIDPIGGRSPNFTAVPHKTYFGIIPDVRIPIRAKVYFNIRLLGLNDKAQITVTQNDKVLEPNTEGLYQGTYGDYQVTVKEQGYRCFRETFNIPDNADAASVKDFAINLVKVDPEAWDGFTRTEPTTTEGVYQIETGAELAWIADYVTTKKPGEIKVVLNRDIDLADYDWTPIGGNTTATGFTGDFDGASRHVSGLYINEPTVNYRALFGYNNGTIHDLTVDGSVTGKQYTGGIAAMNGATGVIDRCVNNAAITALSSNTGGISGSSYPKSTITNCINNADITGQKYCAGITGNAAGIVRNCYSIGEITGDGVGACLNGSTTTVKDEDVENVFCIKEYVFTQAQTLVTEEQMASGEVAYHLGEAFGQQIGTDPYPVLGGVKVYLHENGTYSNSADGVDCIDSEKSSAELTAIYGLDGLRRSSLCRGVNIIVYSDGTIKKINVK